MDDLNFWVWEDSTMIQDTLSSNVTNKLQPIEAAAIVTTQDTVNANWPQNANQTSMWPDLYFN